MAARPSALATTGGAGATCSSAGCTWSPAIAWIGASFYFIALDNHLEPPRDPRDAERGVGGEAWEIHGGGFYRVEKFRVAPERLPEPLHWFKWEAYTTWLSGFALFVVVYYVARRRRSSSTRRSRDLSPWEAIAISIGGLALAWLVYDGLCRLLGDRRAPCSRSLVFAFVALAAWARVAALRAARRVPPGRRDARDDDGRQRLLRDHPGALGARAREGGGPRARPALERARASSARCTTTTSRCRSSSRCSRTTSRSPTGTRTPGSSSSR